MSKFPASLFTVLIFTHIISGLSLDYVFPPHASVYGNYKVPLSSPSSECHEQACDLIKEEVESLSRLKIIRTYVTETVRLLDSLMESMDEELVKVAIKIKETGADSCPDLPSPLDYIAEPMDKHNSVLSAGIMEESSASDNTNSQRSLDESIEILEDDLSSGIEQSTSNDGHDSNEREWSPPGRQNNINNNNMRPRNHVTSSTSATSVSSSSSWSPQNNRNNLVDSREDSQETDTWNGISSPTSNTNIWSVRENPTNNRSHSNKGRQLHHGVSNSQNSGSSTWQPLTSTASRTSHNSNCRGIHDSPYYVPGIDNWCVMNCNRGYCPTTHCTCQN